MKDSFIMYNSYYEAIKHLPHKEKGMLLDAIFEYNLNGVVPDLTPVVKMAFNFMKGQFDRDAAKYEKRVEANRKNGLKGGRPSSNAENPIEAKKPIGLNGNPENPTEAKKPDTDDDTDTDTVVKDVVVYLNSKTGKNFRSNTEATKKFIRARLNDKFNYKDFKKVIDNKCSDWLDTEMDKYLRPETLFGSSFEGYLNERIINGVSKDDLPPGHIMHTQNHTKKQKLIENADY